MDTTGPPMKPPKMTVNVRQHYPARILPFSVAAQASCATNDDVKAFHRPVINPVAEQFMPINVNQVPFSGINGLPSPPPATSAATFCPRSHQKLPKFDASSPAGRQFVSPSSTFAEAFATGQWRSQTETSGQNRKDSSVNKSFRSSAQSGASAEPQMPPRQRFVRSGVSSSRDPSPGREISVPDKVPHQLSSMQTKHRSVAKENSNTAISSDDSKHIVSSVSTRGGKQKVSEDDDRNSISDEEDEDDFKFGTPAEVKQAAEKLSEPARWVVSAGLKDLDDLNRLSLIAACRRHERGLENQLMAKAISQQGLTTLSDRTILRKLHKLNAVANSGKFWWNIVLERMPITKRQKDVLTQIVTEIGALSGPITGEINGKKWHYQAQVNYDVDVPYSSDGDFELALVDETSGKRLTISRNQLDDRLDREFAALSIEQQFAIAKDSIPTKTNMRKISALLRRVNPDVKLEGKPLRRLTHDALAKASLGRRLLRKIGIRLAPHEPVSLSSKQQSNVDVFVDMFHNLPDAAGKRKVTLTSKGAIVYEFIKLPTQIIDDADGPANSEPADIEERCELLLTTALAMTLRIHRFSGEQIEQFMSVFEDSLQQCERMASEQQ